MNMKNKGFTLIELLGTIVILAIIALVAFPAILGLLNNSQNKSDSATQNLVISAAREYVNDNINSFPKTLKNKPQKTYCIKNQTLIDEGYISTNLINDEKNTDMKDDYIKVISDTEKYTFEYKTDRCS